MEPREPILAIPAWESAPVAPALDPREVDGPGAIEYASWLRLLRQQTPSFQPTRPTASGETK